MSKRRSQKKLDNMFSDRDNQAAGFFYEDSPATKTSRITRVVELPLSQCVPDRFQARLILPADIKVPFFSGAINCYEAAAKLLATVAHDQNLSILVDDLLKLGLNIMQFGQIEPATGSWVQGQDGKSVFAIEVGERRFWSLALLAVVQQLSEEPLLRVIEETRFDRERQIAENVQREGNTAVDLARAAAGLILLRLEITPDPSIEDDFDYFRSVLEIKRLPNGTWPALENALKLSRPALERHMQLLQLPSHLLYLAKMHALPEGRLREIVAAPAAIWEQLMLLAVQENYTAREIQLIKSEPGAKRKSSGTVNSSSINSKAANRLKAYHRLMTAQGADMDFEAVAAEYSVSIADSKNLIELAEHLEQQAQWLRKMFQRRN